MYADDIKIFSSIRTNSDCIAVQSDLCAFAGYCRRNRLQVNHKKCHSITFTKKYNIIESAYNLDGGVLLDRVTSVRDLGVTLDQKLLFDVHIGEIVAKCYQMLGFLTRTSKSFVNATSLIVLYYAFVHSRLSFCSVVWNPQYLFYVNRLEGVQRRLVRYLNYKSGCSFVSYEAACRAYGLVTLRERRMCSDVLFVFKLVNGLCDSSALLSMLQFHVPPRNSRQSYQFYGPMARTNAYRNSPIVRMQAASNECNVDHFAGSLPACKQKLLNKFRN